MRLVALAIGIVNQQAAIKVLCLLVSTTMFFCLFVYVDCTQLSMVVLTIVGRTMMFICIAILYQLFRARKGFGSQKSNVYAMMIVNNFVFCVRKFWETLARIKKKLTYILYHELLDM